MVDLLWTILRDGNEYARAANHTQVAQIIRHAQRLYPNSTFKPIYTGRNLGIRSAEELGG